MLRGWWLFEVGLGLHKVSYLVFGELFSLVFVFEGACQLV